jgi:hypothetical protein
MKRLLGIALLFAACPPSTVIPRLCVSSVLDDGGIPRCEARVIDRDAGPDTVDAGQQSCAQLIQDRAILVQHALPAGITPYGNDVLITLTSGGNSETRPVTYGELSGAQQAQTVFDFPDGGPSLITIHAEILNSELSVTGTTGECPVP